jgi:hypothetical protein
MMHGKKALLLEMSDFLTPKEEYTKTIDAKMAKLKEEGYHYVVCIAGLPKHKLPRSLLANLYRESKYYWGWVDTEEKA